MAAVWQISIVAFPNGSIISGVILNTRSKPVNTKKSMAAHLWQIAGSYARSPLRNIELSIEINNKTYPARTDIHGGFSLMLEDTFQNKPQIKIRYQNKSLDFQQQYPFYFTCNENRIGIISDFDDTIMVSHTAKAIKRIGTLALTSVQNRKLIPFTSHLIRFLEENNTGVMYVSKSESNLFGILSAFILKNKLPQGPLWLTPYRGYKELFTRKKEEGYKQNLIELILKHSGNKQFVFFGDDTQKDMEVYAAIAKKYPDRFARIYIRQTRSKINSKKQNQWNALKRIFPASVYFNENTAVENEFNELKKILKT